MNMFLISNQAKEEIFTRNKYGQFQYKLKTFDTGDLLQEYTQYHERDISVIQCITYFRVISVAICKKCKIC